jgi:hypothetical protein
VGFIAATGIKREEAQVYKDFQASADAILIQKKICAESNHGQGNIPFKKGHSNATL